METSQSDTVGEQEVLQPHLTSNEDDLSEGSQELSSQGSSSCTSQKWWRTPSAVTPFKLFGTKTFKNTAEILDRFHLPLHQAAQLINVFHVDTSVVGEGSRDKLIDPHNWKGTWRR